MKNKILTLIFIISFINIFSQDSDFRPTTNYEGFLKSESGKKININMNFLILLDSSMVGSYYYFPKNGSLKLVGKLKKYNSFTLYEWNAKEENTGIFNGKLTPEQKTIKGTWTSIRHKKYTFNLSEVVDKTYWSIIKKNRNLYEYKDFKSVFENPSKVLSIDMANQDLSVLPPELSKLSKINSINLLGNKFIDFPIVLTKLTSLDEISLSTNKLENINSEISELQNLKILILNNNRLSELPKEIGKLKNLQYLELGNNNLKTLPNEIKNLKKLEEMHLERNKFSEEGKNKIRKLLPNCVIHF